MQTPQTAELSWSERILQERWNKERDTGILKGMHELLLFQLTCKFSELPSNFVNQLCAIIDQELLGAIAIQVLTAQSLDDITLSTSEA